MGNLFILISVAFNVLGQAVLKAGVNKYGVLDFRGKGMIDSVIQMGDVITTPLVFAGLFSYLVSSVFWIIALSHKDLSYAYPMLSAGYVIILLVSWFILGEQVTVTRIFGVLFISFGLALILKSG